MLRQYGKMKHLTSLENISKKEILEIISLAEKIKKSSKKYSQKLKDKTLLMLFAKPSLRTHISFDLAMYKLGGHSIFYDLSNSPLGKKESMKDGSIVMSNYVDIIMARLFEHRDMQLLAKYSKVPIISGLDNEEHPCQILGDLLTIKEKFKRLKDLNLTYIGDANNNVTHSLLYGCSKIGMNVAISCPKNKEFMPNPEIVQKAKKQSNAKISIIHNPKKAVENADIIYTDSWQSYHIPDSQMKRRVSILEPYQVNNKLLSLNKKMLFMHCLPAGRGMEVTDEVIDSKRSIVYAQAYNRLPIQQAIILKLLNK